MAWHSLSLKNSNLHAISEKDESPVLVVYYVKVGLTPTPSFFLSPPSSIQVKAPSLPAVEVKGNAFHRVNCISQPLSQPRYSRIARPGMVFSWCAHLTSFLKLGECGGLAKFPYSEGAMAFSWASVIKRKSSWWGLRSTRSECPSSRSVLSVERVIVDAGVSSFPYPVLIVDWANLSFSSGAGNSYQPWLNWSSDFPKRVKAYHPFFPLLLGALP